MAVLASCQHLRTGLPGLPRLPNYSPSMALFDLSLVWFRRDLRTFDQAALHEALSLSRRVHCVFVFDRDILRFGTATTISPSISVYLGALPTLFSIRCRVG